MEKEVHDDVKIHREGFFHPGGSSLQQKMRHVDMANKAVNCGEKGVS